MGGPEDATEERRGEFRRTVAGKEQRKLRARRGVDRGMWYWVGMFGLVGWSVAVPTVAGLAVGVWIDSLRETRGATWTFTFLVLGAAVGCLTAWYWVKRESRHVGWTQSGPPGRR